MIVGYGSPRAVISGSVSAALRRVSSASSAAEEHEQLVERRDALAPLRGVRRAARDGQPERDRAGVGDDDVEVRRLRDDREVAGRAGPDRGERALPAVLLGRDERDEQLAGEPIEVARRAERPDRGQDRRHAALHVAGAAAVQRAVADLAAPRIGGPGRRDRRAARRRDGPTGSPAGRPARPARPMTTGSAVRGISSPGQSGSARIAAGSGATTSTAQAQRRAARRPPRPRPPPRSR